MKKIVLLILTTSFLFPSLGFSQTEDKTPFFKNFGNTFNPIFRQINSPKSIVEDNGGNEFIQEGFSPLSNYLLGAGDLVQISILSDDYEFSSNLGISPEGKIFVPKVGEFSVSGITTEELKKKIFHSLKQKNKKAEVSVLLKKIRSIRVFLTGYVRNPGAYEIANGTRLLELLKTSGGVSENSSLRNIEINSEKNKSVNYDLYSFIFRGNLLQNPQLNPGERIFIPAISQKIAITGNVANPGVYEFKKEDRLDELLKLAGIYLSGTDPERIILWKNGMKQPKEKKSLAGKIEQQVNNLIEDGDLLYITPMKQPQDDQFVHVYGQVNRPGSLPFKEGMKLSDYIKLSGGFSQTANSESVKVTRMIRENNQVITKTFTVNLEMILFGGKNEADLLLENNDVVYIPEKFFNFRNFSDISSIVLSTLGIISLVLSFTRN